MDRSQALSVLGLTSAATAAEIKEAYRDLAKVWHPDRFGDDPRLRAKAEETLKGINLAYQALQSGAPESSRPSAAPPRAAPPPPRTAPPSPPPPRSSRPVEPQTVHARREEPERAKPQIAQWVFGGIVLLVFIAVAAFNERPPTPRDRPTSAVTVKDAAPPEAPAEVRSFQRPASPRPNVRPLEDTRARTVRELSELSRDEQHSIEAVCSSSKYMEGPAAYNACVRRQLDAVADGPRRPDVSALTRSEQNSIEAVCSSAKYMEGPAAYNRCVAAQLATLAAGPRRPDLSWLTRDELHSIEAVCSSARYMEGPAAYNRCLIHQLSLLKQQRPD
jgi:hypothetical protein